MSSSSFQKSGTMVDEQEQSQEQPLGTESLPTNEEESSAPEQSLPSEEPLPSPKEKVAHVDDKKSIEEQKKEQPEPTEETPSAPEEEPAPIKADLPEESLEPKQPAPTEEPPSSLKEEPAPVMADLPKASPQQEQPEETPSSPEEEPAPAKADLPEESPQQEQREPTEEPPSSPEEEAAHVDFDLLDTEGRWLLKVVSGPNTGAEFAMHTGSSYLLGTDAKECDIVFQDLSISRKHARISVDQKEKATLEDLGSRNGTFIAGEKVTKKEITGNVLVTIGTTSFMLYDKEAEHTTVIAPSTQPKKEEKKPEVKEEVPLGPIQQAVLPPLQSEVDRVKEQERVAAKTSRAISTLIILGIVTGLILFLGVGITFLFRTEEVTTQKVSDPEVEITKVLAPFPAIRFSYNPTNNRLMLVGHVLTTTDRSRLLDSLQQLKFLRDIDYSSVVIDELVWRETNQLLSKNPAWKGISLTSPTAGKYVITGFLRTRAQATDLFDYLSLNFPYMDLLEKKVVIEEELVDQVRRELNEAGFRGVVPTLSNGELTLTGNLGEGTRDKFQKLVVLFKSLPGIRTVTLQVAETGQKEAFVDLTQKYQVSGIAKSGKKSSVVINGRILGQGDVLDGMLITEVTPTTIYLEKDDVKYKIDFNQ